MTTMTCRICAVSVPTGEFCGNCGATASPRRGDGPPWLRLSAYAAAPGEHVLRPAVISTVFPSLPRHFRVAFGVALVGVVALLVGTALPMWVAALIGVVGAGLPALFLAHLKEADAGTDPSTGTLVVVALLSIAAGVGWSIATDVAAARVGDDALGLPASTLDLLVTCLAIPVGFLVLLLAPTIVVRVWRPGTRESLNGLIIGSFGAVCFVTAGSMAALVPELTGGPIDTDGQSPADLVVGGLVQGVAVPLTAAAVGGAIGATLWFVPRRDTGHTPRWYWPTSPLPAVAFGLIAYLGLGVLDFLSPPSEVETVVYALLTVVALYVLRVVAHSTLLHAEPDRVESGSPDELVLCPECEHVVPDLPFCPRCGLSGQATSRTSRVRRRSQRPVPVSS
jgi:hypothetical protein